MRHLGWLFLLSQVVSIGCSPFEGETGQGGSGGGSTSTSTASTASSTAAATSTATTTTSNTGGEGGVGGAGGDNSGGAAGDGGSGGTSSDGGGSSTSTTTSGTGGSSDFTCADVAANHLTVKIRANASSVPSGSIIRLFGTVNYPVGEDKILVSLGTGSDGAEEVAFDLGEAASGTMVEEIMGFSPVNEPAGNDGDYIPNGSYLCSGTGKARSCTADILNCYGAMEVGRYVDGVPSGGFAFASDPDLPNPVFTAP